MRDVKDMGQQMGYRSLEWNWPKEAKNTPIWAGIVDGAQLFNLLVVNTAAGEEPSLEEVRMAIQALRAGSAPGDGRVNQGSGSRPSLF